MCRIQYTLNITMHDFIETPAVADVSEILNTSGLVPTVVLDIHSK